MPPLLTNSTLEMAMFCGDKTLAAGARARPRLVTCAAAAAAAVATATSAADTCCWRDQAAKYAHPADRVGPASACLSLAAPSGGPQQSADRAGNGRAGAPKRSAGRRQPIKASQPTGAKGSRALMLAPADARRPRSPRAARVTCWPLGRAGRPSTGRHAPALVGPQ